jgi:hypothetical protein
MSEHFVKSADVQFTVYIAGHSTPWSSSPTTIYLISIRLMLYFLFFIILYLNLYPTVFHYIFISSSLSLFSSLSSLSLTALSHFFVYI